ncbi:hypothetical protein [Achromobacter sp. MFA1 R4]|uniref:hypothetical protein n=1 Tax=Achromobacter sp. MFA1 R4 TaxID=1881016 RepID=UPI0009537E6B|nr:hypothetical protein [Achromobacter sp. MFA1 R4]SIT27940.1 hypothetical protein SAMN05428937_3744 [Achromobacter sp. MFA1 R4]
MTENLNADDLVQLDPGKVGNPLFAGCVMVVTEPKSWGAQGYVQAPGGGQAYYRAKHEEMELVGRAVWVAD